MFQQLPKPPEQASLPPDRLLELVGTGFVQAARANLDLQSFNSQGSHLPRIPPPGS